MDSGHYYYSILDYNTGTWWRCDDDKINNYTWYPKKLYDKLLHENEQNQGKIHIMKGLDRTVIMLYIKRDILKSITYSFCIGGSLSEDIENIKEILKYFNTFKGDFGKN